jgi:pyruvate/2-oxoacid:ferredoxin oxidoreductase beta subunit
MMLADNSLLYVGGAGSCTGCGEAMALRLWVVGGDGTMLDIRFGGQGTKMSPFGSVELGKHEARKEVANIAMMHPNVYVAETTAAHMNHFYRAVLEANAYPGPALINVYTTCQPEHGVGDNEAMQRARACAEYMCIAPFRCNARTNMLV